MESSGSSPATSLRLLRLGDSWVYGVAGTLTPPGGELIVLPTYTAMLGLRRIVAGRGHVADYWAARAA